jgi:aryl-alcohol dehydrogenase-like predicted oxidoreductase
MPTSGRATTEGTRRFAERLGLADSFRETADKLRVASIGLGTYLGQPDDATDAAYRGAVERAVALGCNLIDTAINYRFQRSERAIGAALAARFADRSLRRDEVIIATKGGFVPFDGGLPAEPRKWVTQHLITPGLAHPFDFAANFQHCLAPSYLETMIAWSRRNLDLDTIDIYYLHNPETQRITLSHETFRARLTDAFETLERAVEQNHIASYGIATWTALRALPNAPDYLSLAEIVGLAYEVAGDSHHLRAVQMPYNLFMTEAFAFENQQINEAFMSAIEAANDLGLNVMISAPLMQGRLANPIMPELAETLGGLTSDAQRAIQFVRSSPGVTAALAGSSTLIHLEENLALLRAPIADPNTIRALYGK